MIVFWGLICLTHIWKKLAPFASTASEAESKAIIAYGIFPKSQQTRPYRLYHVLRVFGINVFLGNIMDGILAR